MNKIETVKQGAKLLKQGFAILSAGPLDYYLEDLVGSVEYLMARFSPIKTGDRVELIRQPIIDDKTAWGWVAYKHFLVVGAQGIVRTVECNSKGILVYVEFDNQTWIDRDGAARPVDSPCQFMFYDTYLQRI